ncbi:MAG: phosphoribosylglycinamide formyltransferase [Acidobacteriia bacterium 12-62-4]|nr:MAG: phosphoribosylglycinamide formyltransferase [Acidobacteriia bacterium 12-62-4]
MTRLGVVLSGRGSNFLAIADQIQQGTLPAEIAVVISNRPDAPGLAAARERGLAAVSLPSKGVDREEYDRQLAAALQEHGVDWVVLAGYMRILSAAFIREFPQRILNIHPSLLPAFTGLDAQHQAFDYGVKIAGCTVHFVDEELDHGPIVLQAAVPVEDADTPATLAERILREEHRIYSEALRLLLTKPWRIVNRRVVLGE